VAKRNRKATDAGLTHVDAANKPTMVDVAAKAVTYREATAVAAVSLPAHVARALKLTGHHTKKGPVFDTAAIAGVMAAKRTHELIPFCHPLGLERCTIDVEARGTKVFIRCTTGVHHKTGVEMEALTGASVAALTIYDMCKALSHDIVIGPVQLVAKSGGKRDFTRGSAGSTRRPSRRRRA
jgi:cyclic pyranopterin phosphate synthase